MMTKKHFQLFADSIRAIDNADEAERIAHDAAEVFKADNSRFDSEKFFKACGLLDAAFFGRDTKKSGTVVAIRLNAKHDTNGNPRRVYVVLDASTGDIVDTIKEGYKGIGALHEHYPNIPSPPDFYTTASEYRCTVKHGEEIRARKESDEKGCDNLSAELGRLI